MLSDHEKRIATGLTLAACLMVAVAAGGWFMRLLVLAASSIALWEFLSIFRPGKARLGAKLLCLAVGAAIVLSQSLGPQWTAVTAVLGCSAVSLAFLFDFGRGNDEAGLENHGPLIHGMLYIPCALQLGLSLAPSEQVLIMLAAAATDMGGYYAGKFFGKRKLWPRVSPQKTWAGLGGAIVLCVFACTLHAFAGSVLGWSLPSLPLWVWACLGLLLCLTAQLGDFFESALKRSLGVKDSGSILPGHGGMLDRIDSVLFVLPVYTLAKLLAA
jgi:phosphatidate cytidylyltransferase